MTTFACVFMALVSFAQAGLMMVDAAEGGRATAQAMGQIWANSMADGSIEMDLAGVNAHLSALDPAPTIDPDSDPGAYLHERWLRPRIAGPAPLRIATSVLVGLFLLVLAAWAWPSCDPRPRNPKDKTP